MTEATARPDTATLMDAAAEVASVHKAPRTRKPGSGIGSIVAQVFMIVMTTLWAVPILFALYVALRPQASTAKYGYVSMPHGGLTFQNFSNAWSQGQMMTYFLNSAVHHRAGRAVHAAAGLGRRLRGGPGAGSG